MGTNNRQRRAAKQRARDQRRRQRPIAGDTDPVTAMVALVWGAAKAFAQGDGQTAAVLLARLEAAAGGPDGTALVRRVLHDAIDGQRRALLAHGWSENDLAELEARRLKVPGDATPLERDVRWLARLLDLPPLPAVAPPAPASTADSAMLAKIRALLAKAESTTFPEEAESLSAKAQELMARHRIDHVLVGGGPAAGPVGRRIWIEDPYADAKAQLLAAVATANRCRAVQLRGLGCVHVVGFPNDLDMTELLHTSLLVQATRALAAAGPQTDGRGRSRTRSFRQSFLLAYAWRIGQRLTDVAGETERTADHEHAGALLPVLHGRERQVEVAVAAAFPRVERRSVTISNAAGWSAGAAAAEVADLSTGSGAITGS